MQAFSVLGQTEIRNVYPKCAFHLRRLTPAADNWRRAVSGKAQAAGGFRQSLIAS